MIAFIDNDLCETDLVRQPSFYEDTGVKRLPSCMGAEDSCYASGFFMG